ncbi:MAG TPA: hypothetical protein VEZ40_17620 [Pyrinomonadaceae bacterium]|nr:hypothetical protein [Pyrinomonadaceae bacterium]
MRTLRRICAIALLTAAFSTLTLAEEGWIGTGNKPPQSIPTTIVSDEMPELIIADTGEESSFFDELYEATLLYLQMNLF